MKTFKEYCEQVDLTNVKVILRQSLSRIDADLINLVKDNTLSPLGYNLIMKRVNSEFNNLLQQMGQG